MSINLQLVGEKIRRYREQLQLSLDELSQSTGMAPERLVQFEKGEREPTGDEILILADFFKCDYKFFISNERLAPFEQTDELYRRYGTEFSKADRRNIQEFLFLCECEEFLVAELGRGQSRQPFRFSKSGDFFKGHGADAAGALRRHLGYKPNEIGMDVYEDLRRIGVHVFRRRLGNTGISGLYISHPKAGKCVLVNYSEDVYRQRFTVAHEGAHSILDDEADVVVSLAKWKKGDLVEVRANAFASRYLMPPEFLRAIPQQPPWDEEKATDWANRIKVNIEALGYALREEQLINDEFLERIKKLRLPVETKTDPELPANLPQRVLEQKRHLLALGLSDYYVGLCFDGYAQGIVSRGRLAECLLMDDGELREVAELYGRSLAYGD
jgi:Zn-dependent peptidase ImmA (M78 family)/DNA-binding XRE family transcriptional regulator